MKKIELTNIENIKQILKEQMYIDVPSNDTDLLEDGYLDSLSFVNLLSILEEEFDIRIETEDIEYDYFRTPEDINAFVQNKLNSGYNTQQEKKMTG